MLSNQELNTIFNLPVHDSSSEVFILAKNHSSRLIFSLDFIFNQIGARYSLISDEHSFANISAPKINYTSGSFSGAINISPSGFLDEKSVTATKPASGFINSTFVLFLNESKTGFDIFSAVFFMISRYEEWQRHEKDSHQRFEAGESILYSNNSHLLPVTDIWVQGLITNLQQCFPQLRFTARSFKTIATLDIDNLFAYRGKGFFRTGGAFAKDILKGKFKNAGRRFKVISGNEKDPFDIYSDIAQFCHSQSIPLICFFLMASGTSFDRSLDPRSPAFVEVFEKLKKHEAIVGVHPSYYSEERKLLKHEINLIEARINSRVNFSRQHYLRFDITSTPHFLLSNGITHDFTMGFASSPGFRAGTCFPFYYFDFKTESPSELLFVPFCAMDGAYMVYNNSTSEDTLHSLLSLKKEVEKVNGFFVTVFHERTFDDAIAPGFGGIYKRLLTDHL